MLSIIRRPHYFSHELNREIVELYWNAALSNLAVNLAYIFEPIFLYGLGYSLVQIMYFYLVVYVCYALLIFPVTKITSKIGYKHAIFISASIYVFYWFLLFQIKFYPGLFLIAPIFFGLEKCFYWPPYNADVAISNIKAQRGREVGVLFSLIEFVSIIGPVVGGFLSAFFGFHVLFAISAVFMLSSVYPLFKTPEVYSKHQFKLKNFLAIFHRYPQNFFAYWGYAEDIMLMSLWPIVMFLIVPQVFSVGLIVTFASLIGIMIMLYLGEVIDAKKRNKLLPVAAVFYGLGWAFRFFANSLPLVVGFDVQTRLGKAAVNIPLLSTTYAIAGSRGPDLAIAYAVFYEFSLAMGKIFTLLLAVWILTATGNIGIVFLVVGALTMFYSFLKK
jgi:MFS family permease